MKFPPLVWNYLNLDKSFFFDIFYFILSIARRL